MPNVSGTPTHALVLQCGAWLALPYPPPTPTFSNSRTIFAVAPLVFAVAKF